MKAFLYLTLSVIGFSIFSLNAEAQTTTVKQAELVEVELPAQANDELKRVAFKNAKGDVVKLHIFKRNGTTYLDTMRDDGTTETRKIVRSATGRAILYFDFNTKGTGVVHRIEYNIDGTTIRREWLHLADGSVEYRQFFKGKHKSSRILYQNGDIANCRFRWDGSLWTMSVKEKAAPGRPIKFYYSPNGKELKRQYNNSTMTVTVSSRGKVDYIQTWNGRLLEKVEEPLDKNKKRVIHLSSGKVERVEYLDKDGKVLRVEKAGSLSNQVPEVMLQELDPKNDPTLDVFGIR